MLLDFRGALVAQRSYHAKSARNPDEMSYILTYSTDDGQMFSMSSNGLRPKSEILNLRDYSLSIEARDYQGKTSFKIVEVSSRLAESAPSLTGKGVNK